MSNKVKPDPRSWIRLMDDMIADNDFEWAMDYLKSVRDQVDERGRITTKQTAAILKIRRSIND